MVDRSKISIEAKQRAEDDIRRDVEIAKLGAENALVERVRTLLIVQLLPCNMYMRNGTFDFSILASGSHYCAVLLLSILCLGIITFAKIP